MTNRIALFLGLLILAAVWSDIWFDWGGSLYITRKLDELIGWLAFWR